MRLERERPDGRRDVWEASVDGRRMTITMRIASAPPRQETERFLTAARAQAGLARRAAAMRAQGYAEAAALDARGDAPPAARDLALEAAMREDRDSPAPVAVYADWLQAHGSIVGELMVLHQAHAADAARARRAGEIIAQLRLPTDWLATWGWKHGRWEWLRVHVDDEATFDDALDVVTHARRVFALPLCAALDELRIGISRFELGHEDTPALIAEAGQHAWAASLPRLHLGDTGDDVDLAHHWIGDVGAAITRAFPRLASLRLHSSAFDGGFEPLGVAGLALPELASLVVETCGMTSERVAAILSSELPALAHLELWFGAIDREATANAADLAPLLEGRVLATVTRLALKNSEFGEELVARLATAAIAPRLVELDLSMSTLDDAAARALAASAGRYAALRVLDVDDNFITRDGLAVLRAAFPRAEVRSSEQPKLAYVPAGGRYASIVE